KPPLYYWGAAAALGALPERPELALRLPSAVLGTGAVLGTWATARAVWGAAAGLPAALVLATTFEWTRAAVSARVDMALAAALTAASRAGRSRSPAARAVRRDSPPLASRSARSPRGRSRSCCPRLPRRGCASAGTR